MLPHIIAVMRRWDALHVASAEVRSEGGPLRAAFAGARVADMLNLIVFLAPLAVAVIPMMFAMLSVPAIPVAAVVFINFYQFLNSP